MQTALTIINRDYAATLIAAGCMCPPRFGFLHPLGGYRPWSPCRPAPGAGDHKPNTREQLPYVPLDLGHNPPRPVPTLGLIVEVNGLDLDAVLGQSPHRTTKIYI